MPDGAFYAWADCSAHAASSWDFCFDMMRRAHVAITPGATSAAMAASASCACRTPARWSSCSRPWSGWPRRCRGRAEDPSRIKAAIGDSVLRTHASRGILHASTPGGLALSCRSDLVRALLRIARAGRLRPRSRGTLPPTAADRRLWSDTDIGLPGPGAGLRRPTRRAGRRPDAHHRAHRPLRAQVPASAPAAWAPCTPRTTRCCRA